MQSTFHNYVHHVPGRLRVRSALVKRNQQRAVSATAWLRTLPGVSFAESNTLTGSLTLHYDPALTTGSSLLAALKEAGYIDQHITESAPAAAAAVVARQPNLGSELGAKVAKALAVYVVEQAVTALIAAAL
jgi:hypothetical protein